MERDCYNCNHFAAAQVCPLSKKDIDTCLSNSSRPFWQPVKTDKEKLTEFIEKGKEIDNNEEKPYTTDDHPHHPMYVPSDDPYFELNLVLCNARDQASQGKGKERHANNNPYEDQVICVVGRLLKDHPFGAHAYQVIKKTIEAGRLYKISGPDAAYTEILGAINYAAAMNILIKEKD